ncbi:MAG: hypothetical protein ACM339_13430 [Ignavibacteria bacterium]
MKKYLLYLMFTEGFYRRDNTLTAKVNNYINVNFNFLLIREIGQTRKTQLKEALQLVLTYNLF